MNELDKEYTVDFDHRDEATWHELTNCFQDANLYQTWPYDAVRYGQRGVVRMVLRKGNAAVAAAQARIQRLRGTRVGIAYVFWGPMWQLTGDQLDEEVFRQAVRALRIEFSQRRNLLLRLYPLAHRGRHEVLKQVLFEEGYRPLDDVKAKRTLIVDLGPSLGELRAGLDQKWRNCLNRAEKNGLELTHGEEEGLFDEIAQIYREMATRKGLLELSDISHLRMVQRDLPPNLKMKIILCRQDGALCAGGIFAAIGTTGLYLIGATSGTGLKTNGSYLVQWAFVKWLKENGFQYYDLNGINPESNPGTYHFKRGLAGKDGIDAEFLGKFQVADSLVSGSVVRGGEWFMGRCRRMVQAGRSLFRVHNGDR